MSDIETKPVFLNSEPVSSVVLGDCELTGDENSYQAQFYGTEAWVDGSDTWGTYLTDVPSAVFDEEDVEDDNPIFQRGLTLSDMIPPELVGRKLRRYEVFIKLEFEDDPQVPDSPEAA